MELVAFGVLFLLVTLRPEVRDHFRSKPVGDWVIDLSNLFVQGVVVPLVAAGGIAVALAALFPAAHHAVTLPFAATFLLSFVLVDYAYYWNHRLFHGALWPVHQVHHSSTAMDLFATSRNTLWTTALIVYVWTSGLALFLLADPTGYLLGASLTAILDLWRHTPLDPPAAVGRFLGPWLILPADHARHHAEDVPRGNFGANLKLWDRVHHTLLDPDGRPLGRPTGLSVGHALLWPFR